MIGDRHRDRDVDADHADVDALREFARRVAVAGEDRDTVAVLVLRRQFECGFEIRGADDLRSEEHTSELQSLMRISYAVFCLKKKQKDNHTLTKQIIQPIS